jgi:UDP-N-acetylmuramyl pentapeptide phosphotransferase/UDP-N-acetylglucosamine-1-phosphate transferase
MAIDQGTTRRHDSGHQDAVPRKGSPFDVRTVIAALIGFYGIVLIVMGLVDDTAAQRAKTGNLNANLWAGIVMTVVAAGFVAWVRLRPATIESRPEPTDD